MPRRSRSKVDATPVPVPMVPTVALAPKRHAHCLLIDNALFRGAIIALSGAFVFWVVMDYQERFAPEGLVDVTI